ncbi:MAG TPA: nucleotide exchange factor GrpE [Bacteroidetes bacterium]|nr:nucleotide exchange factor GrpE [Bacteroidota bacterium]
MVKKNSGKKEEKDRQSEAQQTVKEDNKARPDIRQAEEEPVGEREKESNERESSQEAAELEKEEVADKSEKSGENLEAKLAELQDKYLRLSAEFDNYRKRTLRERIELTKSAGESILVKLLPVMDDFDRAMSLMENVSDCKAMKEGINLIYGKMKDFLKQNGVKEIEAMDKDFDTDLHEAVTKIPASEKKKKGKIVDVIQKGYYLNDKIIRYSKVVVGE